jgi:hypothetical protein
MSQCIEFWAFIENSDFERMKGDQLYRQDEIVLSQHDRLLEQDYGILKAAGTVGVRDAARWYVTNPAPGVYDWSWLDRVVDVAARHEMKLYLDLWHYGYPDWLDLMSADAPAYFADFARQIALRYPDLHYWCICNEPSLMVDWAGPVGKWRPFLKDADPTPLRQQICRMIIAATRAVLELRPDDLMVIPEPWFSPLDKPEDDQAAVLDTLLGLRDPHLGGESALVDVIGLNHYRDSTLPPFHRLILRAKERWPDKPLWITETSGPPTGWQQAEWFWWMLAETRLANAEGAGVEVFTWAPALSMYDWDDETLQLLNGLWKLDETTGQRVPNGNAPDALKLARELGYLC